MKKLLLLLLGMGILGAICAFVKTPRPPFPIGKETTYITEPLDADGRIDYVAAVNNHWSRGVTPANNGIVLIWKALGPRPEGRTMPDEYFKWLGIKQPPEHGDYFVPVSRFAREQLKLDTVSRPNAFDDEISHCSRRPWKAAEHPNVAAWLKANEKSLALVVEASKRTHYYSPLVPNRAKDGPTSLLSALLPTVQRCRELALMLTTRALLRVSEGRFDDAWQDLLACHRVGRLVAHGATLIELLVGIAVNATADSADLAFVAHARLNGEQIHKCLRQLQDLPPMPLVADKLDFGERFSALEVVTMMDRHGPEVLESLFKDAGAKTPSHWAKLFQANVDYEPALRNVNRWYDRIVKVLRVEARTTREKELVQLDAELKELKKKTQGSMPSGVELLFANDSAKIRGETIGNLLICLMLPAFNKVQSASDRCEQSQHNIYLAFALAAYHRDHGGYPRELAALKPKYLDKIPIDLFSGEPLVYRPSKNGYLLYSVGVNGRDEEGRGSKDEPQGDDLSVRMPLPKHE